MYLFQELVNTISKGQLMLDDYVYIYKDVHGRYNLATNPRFIASHRNCRAVPKNFINNDFSSWSDFMLELNSDKPSVRAKYIIYNSDLREIYQKDTQC